MANLSTLLGETIPTLYNQIQPVTASVASNALTVGLNSTNLWFRNTTVGGAPVSVVNSSPLSLTVPTSATLGTVSTVAARLVLLALNNAGTMQLGIVNLAGGTVLDESGLVNATAITSGSTSNSVIYSTSALTGVAYRVVGYVDIVETTAGTWATAPTNIQGNGGQILAAMSSIGYGQTWQSFAVGSARVVGTVYYNTTGKPIVIQVSGGSSSATTFSINGTVMATFWGATSGVYVPPTFIVPPGASYTFNTGGGTPTSWFELR